MQTPQTLAEFKKALADSRAFGVAQEEIILQLTDMVFSLGEELRQLKAQPLALDWVSPEQACQILKRSAPTVRKLARDKAFAINENPGYQKGKRKMEYYLPGIRKYLFRQNVKQDAIEARIQETLI